MPYDKEKDKLIEDLGPVGETGMFGEIRAYENDDGELGEQKLTVFRPVGKEDKRRQVFRIPLGDVEELADFLSEVGASVEYVDESEEGEGQ